MHPNAKTNCFFPFLRSKNHIKTWQVKTNCEKTCISTKEHGVMIFCSKELQFAVKFSKEI